MKRQSLIERFCSKVDTSAGEDGCWLWTAKTSSNGYGRFSTPAGEVAAHRFAYTALVGPIPAGLDLDHVKDRGCTQRSCVNPRHLEPVTRRVNLLRGAGITARNAEKTQCVHGHPLSGDNLRVTSDGRRQCRACQRTHARNAKLRKLQPTTEGV